MATGLWRYCYEKKKSYAWDIIRTGLMVQIFFSAGFGFFKNGTQKQENKKRKLIDGRVSSGFYKGFGNNFLDGIGHWMREWNESSCQSTFWNKNRNRGKGHKSITALFPTCGIYGLHRRIPRGAGYKRATGFPGWVNPTGIKSSGFTMVYVTGFFQFAVRNITEPNYFFYQYQHHEKSRTQHCY